MALWVGAMALSLYTPHEGNLYEAFLHIKAVLVCSLLGLLHISPAEIRPVVRYTNAVYPHEFPLLYELKT